MLQTVLVSLKLPEKNYFMCCMHPLACEYEKSIISADFKTFNISSPGSHQFPVPQTEILLHHSTQSWC